MTLFAGNKLQELFLVRFSYHHCCVSVIMRLADYFISSHSAHGQFEFETPALMVAERKDLAKLLAKNACYKPLRSPRANKT